MLRLRTSVIVVVVLLAIATGASLWMTAWPRWQDQATEAAVAAREHDGRVTAADAPPAHRRHSTKVTPGPAKTAPQPPSAVYSPSPAYPIEALRQHREGVVTLRVSVDAHGVVSAVEVARSSGDRDLDASALQSVRQWRFQAPTGHQPMSFTLPVRFRITPS